MGKSIDGWERKWNTLPCCRWEEITFFQPMALKNLIEVLFFMYEREPAKKEEDEEEEEGEVEEEEEDEQENWEEEEENK